MAERRRPGKNLMRVPLAVPLLASLLVLAGCMDQGREAASAETQAGLAKALAGLTPAPPTSCIPLQLSPVGTHVYGKVLLYKFSNGDTYRNDTAGGCEGGGDDVLVQVELEGRPCSGDIIRTVDRYSHMPTGSCSLGQFTPYLKPRR